MIYNHHSTTQTPKASGSTHSNSFLNQSNDRKNGLRGTNHQSSNQTKEFFQIIMNKAVTHFPHLDKMKIEMKGNNFSDLSSAIDRIVSMIPEPTNAYEQANALIRMRNIADEQEQTIQQNMAFFSSQDSTEQNIENIKPEFRERSPVFNSSYSSFNREQKNYQISSSHNNNNNNNIDLQNQRLNQSSNSQTSSVNRTPTHSVQYPLHSHNTRANTSNVKTPSTAHTTPTHQSNDKINAFSIRKISIQDENQLNQQLEDLSSNQGIQNHNTELEIRMQQQHGNNVNMNGVGCNLPMVNNNINCHQLPLENNDLRNSNFLRQDDPDYKYFDFYNPENIHRERDEFNPVFFSKDYDNLNEFQNIHQINQYSVNFLDQHQPVFSSSQDNNFDQFLA